MGRRTIDDEDSRSVRGSEGQYGGCKLNSSPSCMSRRARPTGCRGQGRGTLQVDRQICDLLLCRGLPRNFRRLGLPHADAARGAVGVMVGVMRASRICKTYKILNTVADANKRQEDILRRDGEPSRDLDRLCLCI